MKTPLTSKMKYHFPTSRQAVNIPIFASLRLCEKVLRRTLTGLLILNLSAISVLAGNGEGDPRAMGMARANTAVAENTEAYLWNPANLGMASLRKNNLTINILSAGFRLNNNVLTIPDYNKYNGKVLSEKDQKDILDLFGSDNSLDFNGDFTARAASIQYLNYALDFSIEGNGFARMPKEVVEIMFNGYELGSSQLSPNGNGGGNLFFSLGASAGFSLKEKLSVPFKDLSAGLSLKYYHGFTQSTIKDLYAFVEQSDSIISRGRLNILESHGGNGFAADAGLAVQFNDRWSAGLCVQNALSSIAWSSRNKKRLAEYTVRTDDFIDLQDDLVHSDTTIDGQSYSRKLPMILRAGVGFKANRTTLLAMDVEHFLTEEHGDAVPRIAAGAEFQTSSTVYVRTGVSVGGDNRGFNLAAGGGFIFGKYQLDLATNNLESIVKLRRFSFALGCKVVIR